MILLSILLMFMAVSGHNFFGHTTNETIAQLLSKKQLNNVSSLSNFNSTKSSFNQIHPHAIEVPHSGFGVRISEIIPTVRSHIHAAEAPHIGGQASDVSRLSGHETFHHFHAPEVPHGNFTLVEHAHAPKVSQYTKGLSKGVSHVHAPEVAHKIVQLAHVHAAEVPHSIQVPVFEAISHVHAPEVQHNNVGLPLHVQSAEQNRQSFASHIHAAEVPHNSIGAISNFLSHVHAPEVPHNNVGLPLPVQSAEQNSQSFASHIHAAEVQHNSIGAMTNFLSHVHAPEVPHNNVGLPLHMQSAQQNISNLLSHVHAPEVQHENHNLVSHVHAAEVAHEAINTSSTPSKVSSMVEAVSQWIWKSVAPTVNTSTPPPETQSPALQNEESGTSQVVIGGAAIGLVTLASSGIGYSIWKKREPSTKQLSLDVIREAYPSGSDSRSLENEEDDDGNSSEEEEEEEDEDFEAGLEVGPDVRFWSHQADYSAV